jgi:cation:H+ antiporter
MFESVGMFVLGLVLLALGGDSVVKGASGLGRHFNLSPFATGLLLVAFGTSLPELAVNARAAFTGAQSLALGNAVGSNLANFGLTLGIAACAAPLAIRWRALSPLLLCFLLACALVVGLGWDGVLARWEGLLLLAAFAAVVAFAFARSRAESPELRAELEAFEATRGGLAQNALRLAIGAVVLYFGAKFVVGAADVIGTGLGMSPLVTGLLPVAVGTALPEIAAAVVAARRGQGDMVAGHVIGSSLFNLTVVVGGMAAFRPVPLPDSFLWLEVPAAAALALALYPMLRGDLRIARGEGVVLVVAFLAWAGFELYRLQGG